MVTRQLSFGPSAYRIDALVSFPAPTLAMVRSIPLYTSLFCYGDLLRGRDTEEGVFVVSEVVGRGGYSSFALLLHPAIDDTLLATVCKGLAEINAVYEAMPLGDSTILKVAALPADLPRVEALIQRGSGDTWIYARLHESPGFMDYVPRTNEHRADDD